MLPPWVVALLVNELADTLPLISCQVKCVESSPPT